VDALPPVLQLATQATSTVGGGYSSHPFRWRPKPPLHWGVELPIYVFGIFFFEFLVIS
jgi:hypothetical protein